MLQRRVSPAAGYWRRTLQIVALVGTLMIGILAIGLIVSQTPWFKDWLRRFVIRESQQYLNGTLSIGSLRGDLFYGIQLSDVTIDVNGEHIVTLKQLEIKYSIAELISRGIIVREIRLDQPVVRLHRDAEGWNVAHLVKREVQEANRQGPRRSISMPEIEIAGGQALIDDQAPAESYQLPKRIDGVNVRAGFEYEPVHYSLTINQLSFTGTSPDLTVQQLTGRLGTREDNLNVEKLALRTSQSSVTIDGVIRSYLRTPALQVTVSAPQVSLPEFSGVLPALKGYALHPAVNLKAAGPQDHLDLTIDARSEAGSVRGTLLADLQTPDVGARGDLNITNLNLATLLKTPARKSDITGHGTIDLRIASAPAGAPVLDRLHGRFTFEGPRVVSEGYTASALKAKGEIAGRQIAFDAAANAYGGSATAKGVIVSPARPGIPVQYELQGRVSHVDLRALPASLPVPRLATDLNASEYHVKGQARNVEASATLEKSTAEGATVATGTTAELVVAGRDVRYAARGNVRDVDLHRVGQAFQIDALGPEYTSRINGQFDVRGSGTTLEELALEANATITESEVFGGTVPHLVADVRLAHKELNVRANGDLRGFDPARVTGNDSYKGEVNGTVDGTFDIRNVSEPLTLDTIAADGHVMLAASRISDVSIDAADIQGRYADRRGDIRQATIKGADLDLQASGPVALDRAGNSNVKYHVTATNLEELGRLVDQPLAGSAVADGTLTGNGAELKTTGTLRGSNVKYEGNSAFDLNSTFSASLPDLDITRAQVHAETKGTFVAVAGLHINDLTATTTYAARKLDFQTHLSQAPSGEAAQPAAGSVGPATRELDATGTVIFHPDHQEIHLPSLALRTQGVEWKTAPGGEAAVQYGSRRLQLQNMRLVNGNQSLDVSGEFPLDEQGTPGAVNVRASGVDLAQLDKLLLQNRGFSGTLTADAKITGTAKAPAVDGHLEVVNGGFQQFTYQSLTANGSYVNDRTVLDVRLQQSPGAELTAKGTIPMSAFRPNPPGVTGHIEARPGDELDVRIQTSRIDLGLVQGFTNQLAKVTGTLQADARVTGSGQDPHLSGYIDVQNGAFNVLPAGVSFQGLTTRIELEPDRIHVPRFQLLDQHGKALTIEGDLAVHEGKGGAVNVSIESDDFKILDNQLGNVHVESHLKLTGDMRRPQLVGDLRTDAARLEIDQILLLFASPYSEEALPPVLSAEEAARSEKGADEATREALQKGREASANKAAQESAAGPATIPEQPFTSALELNIRVVAPDNLVLRGTDLRPGGPTAAKIGNVNATIGADIQVVKASGGPVTLRGTAKTVRGYYEFQGRRFDLVRDGTIQFLGLPQINPNIDITGERVIPNSGVVARVHLTGRMRAPELTLTSEPPLDEADILSLIVFNQTVNELGTGDRSSLAETAGGIASGFIAAPLGKSIGQALDIDLFEITTSVPVTGETAGGVTLGKQISDKAYIRFRQQFGQRSYTEFMLEYQLARFLRLQTTVAPETTVATYRLTQRRVERGGVDLIFFFSY